MDPTTVLVVDPGGALGGAELVVDTIVRRSDRSRFRFVVACLTPGPWPDQLEESGVTVRVIERGRLRNIGRVLRVLLGLTLLVKREGVDVVHANHGSALVYGSVAARLGRAGLVWHLHDAQSAWDVRRRLFLRFLRALSPDRVIFASPVVRTSWLALWPELESQSSLVLPGVDVTDTGGADPSRARRDLGIPEGSPIVSMFARPVPHKGHVELIEATALMTGSVPDLRVVLCTTYVDPQMDERLKQLRQDLGLNHAVLLPGPVWGSAKEDLLAATSILAHPSWVEPYGLAMLDGMAAGKPVVAYRTDGSELLVRNGVDGILVESHDIRGVADSMTSLLLDPPRCEAMGASARDRARLFTNDAMVEGVLDVWLGLVAERSRTAGS